MTGKIIRQISNLYTVEVDGISYDCRARGKFYHDKLTPLVGDRVKVDLDNKYILELLPRTNSLVRPSIANVDVCLIITSVKEPNLDLNLLDKLLSIIIYNKIKPIICFTKLDLINREDTKMIKKLIKYYKSIGIKVFTNRQINKITKAISNKTVVLTGQTGAGKSSLLNKMDKSLSLDTNPISRALGRGVHTTRHVELFKYKNSLIADTPGFSSLDIKGIPDDSLKDTFPEFDIECVFKDCMHVKEKECNVKKLVSANKILKSRYDNYLKFLK